MYMGEHARVCVCVSMFCFCMCIVYDVYCLCLCLSKSVYRCVTFYSWCVHEDVMYVILDKDVRSNKGDRVAVVWMCKYVIISLLL